MGNKTIHISEALKERILILDGAMGTLIQRQGLEEKDFADGPFSKWPVALKGNNDVLCITRPNVIADLHQQYIDAGADIITTNTFNSNSISQADYRCEAFVSQMALEGARIAKEVASRCTERQVWVAGSMGPLNKSLTMDATGEAVDFFHFADAYYTQAKALVEGGVDLLLLETCYDALNCKAALYAIQRVEEATGKAAPVMVSATVNDRSGRTLTGQTLDAFFTSIQHYPILSFGLNCSFGAGELRPMVETIARKVPKYISLYPNAGLPNAMGEYDEAPEFTASHIKAMAADGLLNIVGGCCGTTPDHIRAIAQAVKGIAPHTPAEADERLTVSGLETVVVDRATKNFINIGERTNVAGSRKFARLIGENKLEEATQVARQQIENGADIIDINMDDAMLDSAKEMRRFVSYISNEPAVARAAFMIDSSDWATILEGLKNAQGKCIVNSISLKEGESEFLRKAKEIRRFGAAVVVMAFDEEGQATTFERKIAIAERAYRLLTQEAGFAPHDIIIDVNVLTIGTGIDEHALYGIDFIKAVQWIKEHLPGAKTSGGVSNLSFAFRGNNPVREAMHSVFLYHAIKAGLDMAIINPGMLQVYDTIDPALLKAVEDVILNTDSEATERLTTLAETIKASAGEKTETARVEQWRATDIDQRLTYALSKGITDHLEADIAEALASYRSAVAIIEGPLMRGMEHVGRLYGEGKMFLPQVVKSAKVMKQAVAILQPEIEKAAESLATVKRPKVVLATVNGDVHDIGKNIVGIVLGCNNFEVIDLGVMVPNEEILEATRRERPDIVCVSGLITPSLKEMEHLCLLFEREGIEVPIFVGGATTSPVHTAVKLAPAYEAGVVHGNDASTTSVLAKKYIANPRKLIADVKAEQARIREQYLNKDTKIDSFAESNAQAPVYDHSHEVNIAPYTTPSVAEVAKRIDWRMLLHFWGFSAQQHDSEEAQATLDEAKQLLASLIDADEIALRVSVKITQAHAEGNDIVCADGTVLPMLRQQSGQHASLADFFPGAGNDAPIGLFSIATSLKHGTADDQALMRHALCARITEAAAEHLQSVLFGSQNAIRPAFGYSACPDHSLKKTVVDALGGEQKVGVEFTANYSMSPSTAICGMLIAHPDAHYFAVGKIGADQLADYCTRRGFTLEEGEKHLNQNL
ncbi:MAG: methionine synthase [Bacteroidales bacterium]|nr:methionine synthase [Bacteroidales bacterium]